MWVVAHQGGWDEALMFAIPILIAIAAVKYAEWRGARKRQDTPAESDPSDSPVRDS